MYKQHMVISSLALATMLLMGCQTNHAEAVGNSTKTSDGKPASTAQEKTETKAQTKTESAPVSKLASAESLGWKLLLHDTFDRKELGDNWKVITGTWEIQDGFLRGNGALISTKGFPAVAPAGYQRLEFEAITDIRGLMLIPGSKPKVVPSDFDSFIHAQSFETAGSKAMGTGYFFQFGGYYNAVNGIRVQGEDLWKDKEPQATIVPDQWYRVVVENDKGTLRFYVNDKLLYENKLDAIVMGTDQDRVGLYFLTAVKVRDIKVYIKRLPNELDVE